MPADAAPMADALAEAISSWRRDGFALLPGAIDAATVARLRERADALMSGALDPARYFFQHDAASGRYEDAPLGEGWVGPSPAYRKIEKLERDEVFGAFIVNPLFEAIARAVIGPTDIALYRAILMNKRAAHDGVAGGTELPWHQDGGRLWGLSAEPELQLWTALDDAPLAAGGLRFARGTHHDGVATALGGAVPESLAAARTLDVVELPARAGDVVLIHNLVWHASGLNTTDRPRRAFSVCFMPATTRCVRTRKAPRQFPRVFDAFQPGVFGGRTGAASQAP